MISGHGGSRFMAGQNDHRGFEDFFQHKQFIIPWGKYCSTSYSAVGRPHIDYVSSFAPHTGTKKALITLIELIRGLPHWYRDRSMCSVQRQRAVGLLILQKGRSRWDLTAAFQHFASLHGGAWLEYGDNEQWLWLDVRKIFFTTETVNTAGHSEVFCELRLERLSNLDAEQSGMISLATPSLDRSLG